MVFTIADEASLSTLTMVIIGASSTTISAMTSIPYVVELLIVSIIFVLYVIVLIPCLHMIDYMLVVLGLQVFHTDSCVMLGIPIDSSPI